MNILRKIKINSLGMYEFSESEKELFEFIKENILNLKQVQLEKYPDYLFYFKDDKCIFQQDLKFYWFGVSYKLLWSVFENKFGYKYNETRDLIKDIVKEAYKIQEEVIPVAR